jgi:hypothetical protein
MAAPPTGGYELKVIFRVCFSFPEHRYQRNARRRELGAKMRGYVCQNTSSEELDTKRKKSCR